MFNYPDLPVVQKREEFLALLASHQVVIVQADTGSGKSTQIPKFLLEWQRSRALAANADTNFVTKTTAPMRLGRIGITQPRRIAALSIADRLREEMGDASLVSTRIRFLEEGERNAPVKVMTDGILLQEFRRDRLFRQYDALMIDEAHERSLNIDILLGIFKEVVQKRPEFRLVVASATIDAQLFEAFFEGSAVLQAEGRLFPVEIIHRDPFETNDNQGRENASEQDANDLSQVERAVLDLLSLGPDNLLCFLPTEREINDLAAMLRGRLDDRFDVLPLFGRLSPQEQRRVFNERGKIRIVLASNIAETSLTIPGIAYVVDTGTARISRYNAQTRIQGLPVEKISQASARQRSGRAGRVKPGVCLRLYSEKDLAEREAYTEPEVRRSNLANVVLQLRSLGLRTEDFPFLQPPPRQAFRGAWRLLHELGAIDGPESNAKVTPLGAEMAKLPMDVALSGVLLRAREMGVLQPALIVASALSLQDARIVPAEEPERGKARETHRRLGGHKSDFLTTIYLWNFVHKEWENGSWNTLRRICSKAWLHPLRLREWVDLYEQFASILKVGFAERVCPPETFHRDSLHMALLSGFLGGIARRDLENTCYRLVGGRECHIFPGSDLNGKSPEWLVAAEVRETSRVFLARGAEIRPEWIEKVAGDFCTRRWYAPTWNAQRGFVEALEEVSFRGMVLHRGRRVDYARIDAEDCARIFWRSAVVDGDVPRAMEFMEHNSRILTGLRALETKQRKWGLAPSEDLQVAWYMDRAPAVNSLASLKAYIQNQSDSALRMTAQEWIDSQDTVDPGRIASPLTHRLNLTSTGKANLPVIERGAIAHYHILGFDVVGSLVFDAARSDDGLTLTMPLDLLERITPALLAVHVEQWREWIWDGLLQNLPLRLRTSLQARKDGFMSHWTDALLDEPNDSPLLSLYALVRPEAEQVSFTVDAVKQHHLRLHIVLPQGKRLELGPQMGLAAMVRAIIGTAGQPIIPCVLGLPRLGDSAAWEWGFCLGPKVSFTAMQPPEAAFWNTWYNSTPTTLDGLDERWDLLEVHGLQSLSKQEMQEWYRPSRNDLRKGLAQHGQPLHDLVAQLPRPRVPMASTKLRGFTELTTPQGAGQQVLRIRRALLRMVWDSALLGPQALERAWSEWLSSFGQSVDLSHWTWLADVQEQNLSLFERVALVGAWLGLGDPWPEQSSYLDWLSDRQNGVRSTQTSMRRMRERFRNWLGGEGIGKEELLFLRRSLETFEKASKDASIDWILLLDVLVLEEKLRLEQWESTVQASTSDVGIDQDRLLRLRSTFRKLK